MMCDLFGYYNKNLCIFYIVDVRLMPNCLIYECSSTYLLTLILHKMEYTFY